MTKTKIVEIFAGILVIFCLGMAAGVYWLAPSLTQYAEKTIIEKPTIVQGEVQTKTETQIAYVPKETVVYVDKTTGKTTTAVEDTDIDATVGKPTLNVKLNGKTVEFQKADNERYVLDKNKVSLQQTSEITFNATVTPPAIDNTKRWALGVGYGDNGVAYKVDFPIGNRDSLGGWVYKGEKEKAAGVDIRF